MLLRRYVHVYLRKKVLNGERVGVDTVHREER